MEAFFIKEISRFFNDFFVSFGFTVDLIPPAVFAVRKNWLGVSAGRSCGDSRGCPREAVEHTSLTLVGIELTSPPGPHVVEGGFAPSFQTFCRAAVFWANSLVLVALPMV